MPIKIKTETKMIKKPELNKTFLYDILKITTLEFTINKINGC